MTEDPIVNAAELQRQQQALPDLASEELVIQDSAGIAEESQGQCVEVWHMVLGHADLHKVDSHGFELCFWGCFADGMIAVIQLAPQCSTRMSFLEFLCRQEAEDKAMRSVTRMQAHSQPSRPRVQTAYRQAAVRVMLARRLACHLTSPRCDTFVGFWAGRSSTAGGKLDSFPRSDAQHQAGQTSQEKCAPGISRDL